MIFWSPHRLPATPHVRPLASPAGSTEAQRGGEQRQVLPRTSRWKRAGQACMAVALFEDDMVAEAPQEPLEICCRARLRALVELGLTQFTVEHTLASM